MDLLRSLPIGLYLEQPITLLHRLDARVKLVWLMTFLAAPLLATPEWRLILVGLLIVLTWIGGIPWRVWRQQMGWLLALGVMIFGLTVVLPDGMRVSYTPRLPVDELAFSQQPVPLPEPPPARPWYDLSQLGQPRVPPLPGEVRTVPATQPTDYRYVLVDWGPVRITRRAVDLGIRFSTLLFTLIYSTNLYLLTTAPEEITAALEDWMAPLRRLRWPVTEIALTLTLALRFIPLVLEEFQNLVRSVRTRAINWQKLGIRQSIQVWLLVAERLLENLLLRADQIAGAMQVRGFTSADRHRVEWHQFQLRRWDWLALGLVVVFWVVRLTWGTMA